MLIFVRLLPVLLVVTAAAFWFADVQDGGPYLARNLIPLLFIVLLCWLTLRLGRGSWIGKGWQLPLGIIGFSIPALGLSAYLHYAYSVNLNDMFTDTSQPAELFRFLPTYTMVAGGIGFAIGWIVGKRV
ncbi:MAG: hypothetical protein QNJ07_10350 [Woeseiaceae bacterium]|nr:hypothetical protein [Woeseiaceae bacterium]